MWKALVSEKEKGFRAKEFLEGNAARAYITGAAGLGPLAKIP